MVTCLGLGDTGSGSSSGSSSEPVNERLCELITTEVSRDILDATPMIFCTIKEEIL